MRKAILVLAATVICAGVCSGCTPILQSDARTNYALHSQFDIDSSIQITIQNIRNKKSECRPFHVSENITILDELGVAHIEYRGVGGMHGGILFLVDLSRKTDKTRVDIYYTARIPGGETAFRTLEYGAKGLPGCP
ncbi:MAG: hypothetical protein FWH34_02770 [Desulfovibrionaceae bacterium]|nr:hypothetical protein [Desulfovibrionaceae bacterium]